MLQAAGYIVAHHTIDVNSKVTGRIAWIGVEKGDKVKAGQVLVRLEDQEFRAQVEQARGAVGMAKARLLQLENGSRPEEIQQANANLDEARANLGECQSHTRPHEAAGRTGRVLEAAARRRAGEVRWRAAAHAVVGEDLSAVQIGPRQEEIENARGALEQAQGQLAYAAVAARRHADPRSGNGNHSGTHGGEGRIGHRAVCLPRPIPAVPRIGGNPGRLTDLQVELDISQNDFAKLAPTQKAVLSTDAYPDREYKGVINEMLLWPTGRKPLYR